MLGSEETVLLTWHTAPILPPHFSHSWDCATWPWFCCLFWNAPLLEWSSLFSRFLRKRDYEVNILNFCRSVHTFILPTYLIDCLAGSIIFWLEVIFLQNCYTWLPCLPPFKDAVENPKPFWYPSLLCKLSFFFFLWKFCENASGAGAWIIWRDELILEKMWEVAVFIP